MSLTTAIVALISTHTTIASCTQIQKGLTRPPKATGRSGVRLDPLDALGRDGRDRHAEPGRLVRQIELEPLRHLRGQRRDDQLVEAVQVERVLDRRERLVYPDHRLHPPS